MPDLDTLLRRAERIPAPDLWPDAGSRPRRASPPGPAGRVAAAVVALSVAGLGMVVATRAFLRDPGSGDRTPQTRLDARVTATIPVGQFPSEIAVGEGGVWVTANDNAPSARWFVARIDAATNAVTEKIEVHEAVDVAVGGGAVWVIGRDPVRGPAVFRIDPASREVTTTVPLRCGRCFPTQVVATGEAVWVTASSNHPDSGEVLRVDPATNQVSAQLTVSGDPRDLVVGEGALWVYSLTHFGGGGVAGGSIHRVDPKTATVTATLLPGQVVPGSGVDAPPVLAVGHGFVWTSRHPGGNFTFGSTRIDIVRIDPRTGDVVGDPVPMEDLFWPIGVDEAGVWFRGAAPENRPQIARLNAETLQIDESIRVDGVPVDGVFDPVTRRIWLANYKHSVTRVDLVQPLSATPSYVDVGASAVPPDCPPLPAGGARPLISATSGPPGIHVLISGPLGVRHPDGSRRQPRDEVGLQAWWNADPDSWADLPVEVVGRSMEP